jgi:hypothetical protein
MQAGEGGRRVVVHRIDVEQPLIPAARGAHLLGPFGDLAQRPQGDDVLGVHREHALERLPRFGIVVLVQQAPPQNDEATHIVGTVGKVGA